MMHAIGTLVEVIKGHFKGQQGTTTTDYSSDSRFVKMPNGTTYLFYDHELKFVEPLSASVIETPTQKVESEAFSLLI